MKKKPLLLLIVIMAFCFSLCAQDAETDRLQNYPRHEFSLSVGDPYMSNLSRLQYFHCGDIGSLGNLPSSWLAVATNTDVYTTLPFTFGYRFRLFKWVWLGGDISYCGFYGTTRDVYSDEPVYKYRENMLCIMPAIRFSYLNREHVTLYSGFAVGIKFAYQKAFNCSTFYVKLPFQLTLFGVAAGSKNWFGFGELGIGNEGILKAGFGYRFSSK